MARTYAALVKNDREFGDYGRWIGAAIDLQQALDDYNKKRNAEASRLSRSVISSLIQVPANFPYSPLLKKIQTALAQAEMIQGRMYCDKKKWTDCRRNYESAFERLLGTVDMVIVRPEDLDSYSKACAAGRTELCLAWVHRLGYYYPHSTIEFQAIAKSFPHFTDQFPRPPYFGKNTQSYHAPDLDQAAFDEAMGYYLDKKYSQAEGSFQKFSDEYPRSTFRYRAHYWLAQSLMQKNDKDEAKKILTDLEKNSPLTFYGLLAALQNGGDFEATLDRGIPIATDFDSFLHPAEVFRLRRAEKLLAAKATDLAALELKGLRARDALSNEFLVYLAMLHFEAQSYSTGFPILNELIARGAHEVYTAYMVKSIFPIQHWDWIKKYSEENKLDPILVVSLMKQESAFDRNAVSSTGALGLMQLMPATAADNMPNQPRAELVKAETNIKTGTKYLGKMLARFNGNIALALASYNAGPGAVDRWMKGQPKDRGLLEFIEQIPYKETRDYVSSIIRNYYWYARKLGGPKAKLPKLDYFWGSPSQAPKLSDLNPSEPEAIADENEDGKGKAQASPTPSPNPSSSPSPTPRSSATPRLGSRAGSESPKPNPSPEATAEDSPLPFTIPETVQIYGPPAPSPSPKGQVTPSPKPKSKSTPTPTPVSAKKHRRSSKR